MSIELNDDVIPVDLDEVLARPRTQPGVITDPGRDRGDSGPSPLRKPVLVAEVAHPHPSRLERRTRRAHPLRSNRHAHLACCPHGLTSAGGHPRRRNRNAPMSRRCRVSYGGRIPPLRAGWPWGPFKLYYFRNYSARIDANGARGGYTSHGMHLQLPMALLLAAVLAVVGLVLVWPVGALAGLLPFLLSKRNRRRLGRLVLNKNWTSGVLTVNPPGWGSFRILPKKVKQ